MFLNTPNCEFGVFKSIFTLRKNCPYSEFYWSKCGKMRTRKTPNTVTFHAVLGTLQIFLTKLIYKNNYRLKSPKCTTRQGWQNLHSQSEAYLEPSPTSETYLEPSPTSSIQLLCENN